MSGENRRRRKKPRSVVFIEGYNALNQLVLEETLSWDEYYEETGHIIVAPLAASGCVAGLGRIRAS